MKNDLMRLRVVIRGAVQGVGFRPFIHNLAKKNELKGWVENSLEGLITEVEGNQNSLKNFLLSVSKNHPPNAYIQSLEYSYLDCCNYKDFQIRKSSYIGEKSALILPDIATCKECLKEIFDPKDRRYLYPFTNCTRCGPRYSIIKSLPYDRENTSMSKFPMCKECQKEYDDENNRRFHAQPNACPVCGPFVELRSKNGKLLSSYNDAIEEACDAILKGEILALKGIGGFQLLVDGRNEKAVKELRLRKHREEKPLALMYGSLEEVRKDVYLSDIEELTLSSPQAPIVLLKKKCFTHIAESVSPDNPRLGIMLPYSPLHHIILRKLGFPLVATSGNFSDDPLFKDNEEALIGLSAISDKFLLHNRDIITRIDDSVVMVIKDRLYIIRRARGYAPLPIFVPNIDEGLFGVGPHLKNTFSFSKKNMIFLSQHIGTLETKKSVEIYNESVDSLLELLGTNIEKISTDIHPDYYTSTVPEKFGKKGIKVQHHYAHILSCMAENQLVPPVIGVSWDGTGFGLDKSIWGGEIFLIEKSSFKRISHLKHFFLPSPQKAPEKPILSALGLLFEVFNEGAFSLDLPLFKKLSLFELNLYKEMLTKKFNVEKTSSAGRLFDAVSAIIGIRFMNSFEGQAAMELEFRCSESKGSYFFPIESNDDTLIINWVPTIKSIVSDFLNGRKVSEISTFFHNGLVEAISNTLSIFSEKKVVLSGGCFQNRYLLEKTIEVLLKQGKEPYWHQLVPPNDGGISVGQVIALNWEEYVSRNSR